MNEIVLPESRVSSAELERRWAEIRRGMADRKIDVLVAQNSNEYLGGYVRYFTDIPAMDGTYDTVIFPCDDLMTVIRRGPTNVKDLEGADDLHRGVGKVYTAAYTASVNYTDHYSVRLATEVLRSMGDVTVGLVAEGCFSYSFGKYLTDPRNSNAKFVDATDLVDGIKAIKSDEELSLIREAASMQDKVLAHVFDNIAPGMKEYEVHAMAQQRGQELGSTSGQFLMGSAPLGRPSVKTKRHFQNRIIEEGDQFTILVENNGAGGFYTELGRTCVLGEPSPEILDEFEFTREAQSTLLGLIRPGADPATIFGEFNEYMRENGRPEEKRFNAHGQGYDLVERPVVCPEETMKIETGMNFVAHPTYVHRNVYSWVCDNYFVGEEGVTERIHNTEQKIFEIN